MKNTNYKKQENQLSRREFLWKLIAWLWIITSWGIAEVMSSCSQDKSTTPTPQQTPAQILASKKASRLAELKSKYTLEQIKTNGFSYKLYFAYPSDQSPEQFFESTFLWYLKDTNFMDKINTVFSDLANIYMPWAWYNGNTFLSWNIKINMEIKFLPITKSQISQINQNQSIYDTLPILSWLSSSIFEREAIWNINDNGQISLWNSIVYDFEKLNNINPPAWWTAQLTNLYSWSSFVSSVVSTPVSGLYTNKTDVIYKLLSIARTNFHELRHILGNISDNALHLQWNQKPTVQCFTIVDAKTWIPKKMLIWQIWSIYYDANVRPVWYTDINGKIIRLDPNIEILADTRFINQTWSIWWASKNGNRTNVLLPATITTDKITWYYIRPWDLVPIKFELLLENRETTKWQRLWDNSKTVWTNIQQISDSLVQTVVDKTIF